MGSSISTPRLYRKPNGTYFVRILLEAPQASSLPQKSRKRRVEARQSLRTRDPALARQLACWVNAVLAQCTTLAARAHVWAELAMQLKKWEVPGVLRIEGREDQRNAEDFFNRNQDLRESLNYRLRNLGIDAQVGVPANLDVVRDAALTSPAPSRRGVPNPMRMTAAIERYVTAKQKTGTNGARTATGKKRALMTLCAQLPSLKPPLSDDPHVHEIETYHLTAFFDKFVVRNKRRKTSQDDGEGLGVKAPATMVKLVSDLSGFFDYAVNELQATRSNPTAGLHNRLKELRSVASSQRESYLPYTAAHLELIFAPHAYLASNREADYFWTPLLGLHLGARLGELVTLKLDSIDQEPVTGVWFMEVTDEDAKNDNSIRRLPITQPLVDLGFLDYVAHVRSLGATYLFPHQSTDTDTWQADPSKNCSRWYAKYMNHIGLTDHKLVFHSFRHTVVTALQDGNAPLGDAMQITGHQAMDHALQTGRITPQQARSVHLDVYTHTDIARMSASHPMLRLKTLLDRCVQVNLDYARLKKAARIVLQHTIKSGTKYKSGWPTLRKKHTEAMLKLLG